MKIKDQSPNSDTPRLRHRVEVQGRQVALLRDRIETQNRQITTLEARLRHILDATGLSGEERQIVNTISHEMPQSKIAPNARVEPADPTFWPTVRRAAAPLIPTPGRHNYGLHGRPLKILGISVCGFDRADLHRIVEMVERQQRETRDFAPVFLTDSTDAEVFRSRGFVFEYLPPFKRVRAKGSKTWSDYAAERRRLLARKWGMTDIIAFGEIAFGRPMENRKIR